MASEKILMMDAASFTKIGDHETILVDFWAPWCGPCRMVAPVLDSLAEELSGKLEIGKLNIDDYPEIAEKYGVQSIPTMILFKKGKEVNRLIGARGKDALEGELEGYI